MSKRRKRSTKGGELNSSSSTSSTDEDSSSDNTAQPRSSKEDIIITMLQGLQRGLQGLQDGQTKLQLDQIDLQHSYSKMRKDLKKLSESYDSLSKLHSNGTSGDGCSTAQRSSISNQAQPAIYKLVFTSGNIGDPSENKQTKKTEYKIETGQTIHIKVALVGCTDRDNETVENEDLASGRVELFVLDNKVFEKRVDQSNSWTTEELKRCITKSELKVSDSQFNLIRGVGSHSCSINVNSSNRKIRLAVGVVSTKERVLQGFSNPFLVREQKQKGPMTDSNQVARINMGEEQPNHQGSSTMNYAQQPTVNAQQAFPGLYQPTLHSHSMLAPMNSQGVSAMNSSEVQRQHIDRGNSQDQALLTGNSQFNHDDFLELGRALSSYQIGTPNNNRNEPTFPLRILWNRPDVVELSKPCWNIHEYLMQRNNCGSLATTQLIPKQSGSLTVTPKEVMQNAIGKSGVRIESLEPDDSDEERPLKRKLHSKYRFRFVNMVCETYYTWDQIKADDGNLLKVALFDENNTMITSGPLSSASVEVIVLHGDFNCDGQDSWTSEEFNCSVVCPRPGDSASVLGGDLTLVLDHGEACLGNAFFQIASFCARTEKFKLGVRLAISQEERIQEGISEPCLVKGRPYADAAWNPHRYGANNDYFPFHLSLGTLRQSKMSLVDENMKIKFHMLEAITKNFSDETKVGSGSFGTVYKGRLYNGEMIAVRKLHPLKGLDDTTFDNVLHNLCKIRHPNIIRFLGYCQELQKNAVSEMERFLCFEYMEHGSLKKHISDNSCVFDWPTSFKIIKGICDGLYYLHSAQKDHLNLKPANILLDENMTPKIEILELCWLTQTYEHGYMPPEYIDRGIISKKFDIFSLGVIIIEILAGNRGYSRHYEMPQKQFAELVIINWKEKLQGTSGYSSLETNIQQVNTCINIALRSADADQNRRPYIKDIVSELNEIEAQIVAMSFYSAQSSLQNKRMMVEIKEEMHNLGKVITTTLKEEFKEELMEICKRSKKLSTEMHQKIKTVTESVNDLRKQLELHINDTSGDESAASRPQSSQVQPPRYRLVFKSLVAKKIDKGQTIETSVALVDGHNNDQTVENGPLASARVELVVLNAKFNQHNNQYNWSREEFESNIEKTQQGNSATVEVDQSGKSIVSDGQFNLVQGFKCHHGSTIVRNSGNKKVRLGVMIMSPTKERVLEGLSNPFFVRGHDRPARHSNLRHNISNTKRFNPAAVTLKFPTNTATEAIMDKILLFGMGKDHDDPWDLPPYFFLIKNKECKSLWTHSGYWTEKEEELTAIRSAGESTETSPSYIGLRKTLQFYLDGGAGGTKTDWVIHEYHNLRRDDTRDTLFLEGDIAICKVFKHGVSSAFSDIMNTNIITPSDYMDSPYDKHAVSYAFSKLGRSSHNDDEEYFNGEEVNTTDITTPSGEHMDTVVDTGTEVRKRKRTDTASKGKSEVWMHYTKIYNTDPGLVYVVCHTCDRGYRCHSSRKGTSHLWRHNKICVNMCHRTKNANEASTEWEAKIWPLFQLFKNYEEHLGYAGARSQ